MKYNVQLHTGSFFHSNITPENAVKQLRKVLDRIPVDTVIWGWSSENRLNDAISETLKTSGCESFLWLPVFSETPEGVRSDPYIPLFEQGNAGIALSSDEHFEFVCPSSRRNMDNALNMASAIAENHYVTGIFLDRIRYPSVANALDAFAGCMCERCREVYRRHHADTERLKRMLQQGDTAGYFRPSDVSECRYRFADPTVDALFSAKREIVSEAVSYLSGKIHSMGLKVGIDTFAPALADFVGQDLLSLADSVDLMKPMFYAKTTAPAGIPFEVEALEKSLGYEKETLEKFWGGSFYDPLSIARQLEPLRGKPDRIAPGVEANAIKGICGATADYILRSRKAIAELGIKSMTLSWNISLISDEIFDILQATEQ